MSHIQGKSPLTNTFTSQSVIFPSDMHKVLPKTVTPTYIMFAALASGCQ